MALLWLLSLFLCFEVLLAAPNEASGCKRLHLQGTQHRNDSSGLYEYLQANSSRCVGRPSYKQIGGEFYLYYHYNIFSGAWLISPNLCSDESSLAVFDIAEYPELITAVWHEYPGVDPDDEWEQTLRIRITCFEGFDGCRHISIQNTAGPRGVDGTYSIVDEDDGSICYGRYTYKHSTGEHFLYSYGGVWAIGDVNCHEEGYARVVDGSLYPERVTAPWEEYYGEIGLKRWHQSPMIVNCAWEFDFAGCHQLQLTGTKHRNDTSGLYHFIQDGNITSCNGRPAYRQAGGLYYIYYHINRNSLTRSWLIGPQLCSSQASLAAFDNAHYPEDITNVWHECPGLGPNDDWQATVGLQANCFQEFRGCKDISIKNAEIHFEAVGNYSVLPDNQMCFGRYTYRQTSGDHYLYNYQGVWAIGDNNCHVKDYIRSQDGAMYPEHVRLGTWEEADISKTDAPWNHTNIQCHCRYVVDVTSAVTENEDGMFSLGIGALIGIVVGIMVLLNIIIIVCVVTCRKRRERRSQSVMIQTPMQQVYTVVVPTVQTACAPTVSEVQAQAQGQNQMQAQAQIPPQAPYPPQAQARAAPLDNYDNKCLEGASAPPCAELDNKMNSLELPPPYESVMMEQDIVDMDDDLDGSKLQITNHTNDA